MPSLESARLTFVAHLTGLNRSEHTIAAYGKDLAQFEAFLAGQNVTEIGDVTATHVSTWLSALADQGLTGASRNRKFQALSAFFKHLAATGQIDRSPTLGLEAPKIEQREPRVLSLTEVKALQGVCQGNLRDAAMVEVLLQTGLRISELVALELGNIVWSETDTVAYLNVRQGKGKKDRRVPLNSIAEKALKRWVKARPKVDDEHVFLSRRSRKPLYPADVRLALHKYYKKAGISGATVHTLRHTFCTQHAARGTNLVVIQRAAGHASLTTTQRYLHLVDRMMEEQLEKNAL